jgi:hypothetical protein
MFGPPIPLLAISANSGPNFAAAASNAASTCFLRRISQAKVATCAPL